MGEGIHFCFHKRPAEAGAGLQAAGRDLLVEAQGGGQVDRIGLDVLAERGQFVDERNLGGDKGSRSFAHQLGGFMIGDDHGHAAHDQRAVNLLQRRDRVVR